jgi:hypothetical protein
LPSRTDFTPSSPPSKSSFGSIASLIWLSSTIFLFASPTMVLTMSAITERP